MKLEAIGLLDLTVEQHGALERNVLLQAHSEPGTSAQLPDDHRRFALMLESSFSGHLAAPIGVYPSSDSVVLHLPFRTGAPFLISRRRLRVELLAVGERCCPAADINLHGPAVGVSPPPAG